MEVIYSSETSDGFQQTTQRYAPEDWTVSNRYCENLTSRSFYLLDRIQSDSGADTAY
jgi:hypothetical protein